MFPRPDYPDGLAYLTPRFMCGGTKVAAMVYSELTYDSFAIVIFDTASSRISSQLAYTPSVPRNTQ